MTVAIIEDDKSDREQIVDFCKEMGSQEKIELKIVDFDSLNKFKKWIQENQPDIMIVDLRLGESLEDRSGWEGIKIVLQREIIPVIVYSAFSEEEPEDIFRNLLIIRLPKGAEDTEKFKSALQKAIRLKLKFKQQIQRIIDEFETLSLETIREILGEGNWEELDERTLAIMAVRRLTSCLLTVPPEGEEKFPPESIYIYPPSKIIPFPKESLFLGNFLENKEKQNSSTLWIVISPSCDLVFTDGRKAKIEEVFLLRCYRNFTEVPFLRDKERENDRKSIVKDRIKRSTVKILKCPLRIFGCNHLLISFKDYRTLPYQKIIEGLQSDTWKKLATLATPYAECLQNQFISDFSRIGTPETVSTKEEEQWGEDFIKSNNS